MKRKIILICSLVILANIFCLAQFNNSAKGLKVSKDGRSLEYVNGTPFFWLGDTGWELFHRLDKKEADLYLETRAKQGFNVIQVGLMPGPRRLAEPNRFGEVYLFDKNLDKINEKYFEFVDYVVNKAASLGLFIAMVPAFGDLWNPESHNVKEIIVRQDNAFRYGNFLGSHFKSQWNIVWLLGGDRDPYTDDNYATIRLLAKGLKQGSGGTQLCTYHPGGDCSSASFFHEDEWLDFNMTQTGHSNRKVPTYLYTLNNYCMFPAKPCLDGEPRYEAIPVRFWEMKMDSTYEKDPYEVADSLTPYGYFNDYDVRTAAYWSVFSGACGHTYGNGSVWIFWEKGKSSSLAVKYSWQTALSSPGSMQMGYLRQLIEQYGINNLRPDRNVITNNTFIGENYIASLRAKDGSAVLIYSPVGEKFKVSLSKLKERDISARWFNPSTGIFSNKEKVNTEKLNAEFTPPSAGEKNDWVLIIESNKK